MRDSLAAERTFLAWIRTGLALMGFGFVVTRLGWLSPSLGTALIVAGVVALLLSAWHHFRLVRELNRGGPLPARPSTEAVAIALFMALVGLAMAIYLVSVKGTSNIH